MAEFKNMTVQTLRDLARKALGAGHSKLKTKAELIAIDPVTCCQPWRGSNFCA